MPSPQVPTSFGSRSEEHTSELQSRENLVCRLLLEQKTVHGHMVTRCTAPMCGAALLSHSGTTDPCGGEGSQWGIDGAAFFFELEGEHRELHSFPTRRSSD